MNLPLGLVEGSVQVSAMEIRYIAPFTTLPPAERAAITTAAHLRNYWHGERLFQATEACTGVIVLLDGFVRHFRSDSDGMEVTTSIVSRGGILTTAALRGRTEHDISGEAIGRVRTIEIPAPIFLSLMSRFPKMFEEIAWELITQTQDVYMDTLTDAHEQLWSRILHMLRRLTQTTFAAGDDAAVHPVTHRLSHAEIARLVGADRSSVTRALRLLDERSLIRRKRGHVTAVRL